MNKNRNSYQSQNNIPVTSSEAGPSILNTQKSQVKTVGVNGPVWSEEIALVFSDDDSETAPIAFFLENKDQVDHLIEVLQKLRFEIYGMDLAFNIIKN